MGEGWGAPRRVKFRAGDQQIDAFMRFFSASLDKRENSISCYVVAASFHMIYVFIIRPVIGRVFEDILKALLISKGNKYDV